MLGLSTPSGNRVRPAGKVPPSAKGCSIHAANSDDDTRIERIQALCLEVSEGVRTSRHLRQSALKLAREALKLAESASTVKRKAIPKP